MSIKDAKGLPPSLSKFVFCQYTFWGTNEMVVVAPKVDENTTDTVSEGTASYKFDHEKVSCHTAHSMNSLNINPEI